MPQYQLEAASHTHAVPLYFYSLDDTFAGTQQPNVSLLFALSRVTTKSLLALLQDHIPESSSELYCLWSSSTVFHYWK